MHVLFQFFPFTVQLKCLLDKQFVNMVIKRTHLFRRLLVESPRLIFGVSSRGGLGQEGQRSNKKHKQAKYQFSEQTSSWKPLIGKTIQLCIGGQRVFMRIGTETSFGLWQILHIPFWPNLSHTHTELTHSHA